MTLLFGLPLAVVLGLVLGRPLLAVPTFAAGWYVFLAIQTSYLAHVGRTGFGGQSGLDALHGPVYWIVQPILLVLGAGLVLLGVRVRRRFAGPAVTH